MQSQILNRVCEVLHTHELFNGLNPEQDIYPVPTLVWHKSGQPLELQVALGEERVLDADGDVFRSDFVLSVGIFIRKPYDAGGRNVTMLRQLTTDIFRYETAVKKTIEKYRFLPTTDASLTTLLTRPLTWQRSSKVLTDSNYADLLVKEVTFVGGLNDEYQLAG